MSESEKDAQQNAGENAQDQARLEEARSAFSKGNYALVSTLLVSLKNSEDPTVAQQAEELSLRLTPSALSKYLLLLTLVCLLAVTAFAYFAH